jgi:hypothetical protein
VSSVVVEAQNLAMPAEVDRAAATVAEAATDFVQGMTITDFAATNQDDIAIGPHFVVEGRFLSPKLTCFVEVHPSDC